MDNKFCSNLAVLTLFAVLQCLSTISSAQDFDFFYFVQQWPGSYCDTKKSCCYPTTGKPPSDFGIHGLWPNYEDGSYPSNCDSNNPYDQSKISELISRMQQDWATLACPSDDGTKFWSHEWDKHGTCSQSVLDQNAYFTAALNLKSKHNLLQILQSAENSSSNVKVTDGGDCSSSTKCASCMSSTNAARDRNKTEEDAIEVNGWGGDRWNHGRI
ncbi:Ribonuclease 1 [Striga hermonthica]|uniref:Ribonuclease 1 n=1 Tax=Striga hermonthica TaxID=68872 RepID=A0A9N7RLN1_STRHE|nr:Ribonuclease 1 [Striga hermonthica]